MRAPERAITAYDGRLHLAWGDFHEAGAVRVGSRDYDGKRWYAESIAAVHAAVRTLVADGVPPRKIAIVGFSQGAALAAAAALTLETPIGGWAMLAGWLLPAAREALRAGAKSKAAAAVPSLVVHGSRDDQVNFGCALLARDGLAAAGRRVECHWLPGLSHVDGAIPAQRHAVAFLDRVLGSGRHVEPLPYAARGGPTRADVGLAAAGARIEVAWHLSADPANDDTVWWGCRLLPSPTTSSRFAVLYDASHGATTAERRQVELVSETALWDLKERTHLEWRHAPAAAAGAGGGGGGGGRPHGEGEAAARYGGGGATAEAEALCAVAQGPADGGGARVPGVLPRRPPPSHVRQGAAEVSEWSRPCLCVFTRYHPTHRAVRLPSHVESAPPAATAAVALEAPPLLIERGGILRPVCLPLGGARCMGGALGRVRCGERALRRHEGRAASPPAARPARPPSRRRPGSAASDCGSGRRAPRAPPTAD